MYFCVVFTCSSRFSTDNAATLPPVNKQPLPPKCGLPSFFGTCACSPPPVARHYSGIATIQCCIRPELTQTSSVILRLDLLPFPGGCRTQIVKEKTLSLTGMVGIYPAATVGGEDVEVYANESRWGVHHHIIT